MGSEWCKITINRQNIIADTGKAVLIALPHKSKYRGYAFWHPAKLVRDNWCSDKMSFSCTPEFAFRLKKYVVCGYIEDEQDDLTVSYDDINEAFSFLDYSDDFRAPEIYTPAPLEPEHAEADKSLIDNEQ